MSQWQCAGRATKLTAPHGLPGQITLVRSPNGISRTSLQLTELQQQQSKLSTEQQQQQQQCRKGQRSHRVRKTKVPAVAKVFADPDVAREVQNAVDVSHGDDTDVLYRAQEDAGISGCHTTPAIPASYTAAWMASMSLPAPIVRHLCFLGFTYKLSPLVHGCLGCVHASLPAPVARHLHILGFTCKPSQLVHSCLGCVHASLPAPVTAHLCVLRLLHIAVELCMLAAGHRGLANLDDAAVVESVQHSAPEQTGKAKGLNPFMAAKLADAIGRSMTLFSATCSCPAPFAWVLFCLSLQLCTHLPPV